MVQLVFCSELRRRCVWASSAIMAASIPQMKVSSEIKLLNSKLDAIPPVMKLASDNRDHPIHSYWSPGLGSALSLSSDGTGCWEPVGSKLGGW